MGLKAASNINYIPLEEPPNVSNPIISMQLRSLFFAMQAWMRSM
jgi:hypothetical protein